jgi:hypothetical protein
MHWEVLSQKGLRKEAAAALRNYLAKENATPDAESGEHAPA